MNPDLLAAEAFTLRLHELIRAGQGDELVADNVREELVEVLSRLPSADRRLLNDLSGDLAMVSSEEVLVPTNGHGPVELKSAWDARDWQRLRSLLVYEMPPVTADYRGFLRGRVWGELGYHRASAEFFLFAWRVRPEKDNYLYLAVQALLKGGDFEGAWRLAREIAASEHVSSTMLYSLAHVLYVGARDNETHLWRRLYERVVEIVDKAGGLQDQPSVTSLRISALVSKAFAQANLGAPDKADVTLTEALHLDDDNDIVLSARGLVRLDLGRQADALMDFVRAVDAGTLVLWPFVHLAEHAILNDDFVRALDLIDEALRRAPKDDVKANLLEWKAFALQARGQDAEALRAANEAEAADPFNERISRHRELIRAARPIEKAQIKTDFSTSRMRLAAAAQLGR